MTIQSGDATGELVLTRNCPQCGATAPNDHRYCGRCGAALPADGPSPSARPPRRRIGGTPWTPSEDAPELRIGGSNSASTYASTGRQRVRKKRRKRTPWHRRKLVVLPLLVLLLVTGAVGALAYRAHSTLGTIHRVSTPPAQITDSTQGDDGLPTGMTFDTGPAQQALIEAGVMPDKGGGIFGSVKDAAGNVGDLASGAAIATGVKDPSKDAITILIMGVDARPGAPIDIGVRPDAMMVLYLNPTSGVCRGLAIPRDSLVNLPGYGETKVNHALMLAGIPYQRLVIEQFLGLKIDHYALIDFTGFKELVDAVGGVTVNVPTEIKSGDSVLFAAGPQKFDGDKALSYARYRGGDDVDVGRVRRQQQLIRGLIQVSSGRDIATDVNKLLPAVSSHVRTDLSASELITLADQYRSKCSEASLEMDTLQGDLYRPGTPDPIYQQPIDYVRIDDAIVSEKVANLIRP